MFNYIINFKNSQLYLKLLRILLFLFILSLFFPIRYTFLTREAYLTSDYSNFTSFSLYLSDIIIFTTWFLLVLPRGGELWAKIKKQGLALILHTKSYTLNPIFWLILVIFLSFITHFGSNTRLSIYFLLKWLELIVAYGTLVIMFRETGLKTSFFRLFSWLSGLQSILALIQFWKQSSIGLFRLGESHLSPSILGVAKIVSGGTRFIRAYGTFPHPNPLSAFLVVGILITLYLLINSSHKKERFAYSTLLFINILGLTVTFSRGAYLALAVGLIMFFGTLFFRRHPDPALDAGEGSQIGDSSDALRMTPIIITILSIVISFFLFKPFLLTRATFSDQSTIDRKFYNNAGAKMIKENPIFGVGLGGSVLHMEQYSGKALESWEKQPPHNYFIIAAAELGIPATLILFWIFIFHLWQLFKNLKTCPELVEGLKIKNSDFPYYLLLTTILLTFLILMQFDHYFYTLQQTQLLLWTILAVIASEIKNPRAGDPC